MLPINLYNLQQPLLSRDRKITLLIIQLTYSQPKLHVYGIPESTHAIEIRVFDGIRDFHVHDRRAGGVERPVEETASWPLVRVSSEG